MNNKVLTTPITRRNAIAALSASAALALSACGSSSSDSSAGSSAAESTTSITVARPNDVAGLDPGFLTESAVVVDNIFDTLVTRDAEENLVPSLALSWEQLDDTTWEFKLREGVKFSNGEDFNAEAVKYSIDRVINPDNNAPTLSYISTVSEVKVVDDYTVDIITTDSDPLIPTRFSRYPTEVVPPAYAEEVGQEEFAQKPVGTGPYKFESWEKGTSVTLVRNDDYWGDAPEVSQVVFRAIAESSTRLSALQNGEVDIITNVGADDKDKIDSTDGIHVSAVERAGNIVYIGFKTDEAPLSDIRVRQALNYAVDVDSIVDNILKGAGVATNSIIGPSDAGYAGEPEGYSYDPEKAKELLEEAGYENGFDLTIDTVSWYLKNTEVTQAIAAMLAEVGVNATVNDVESSVYRETVPAGQQSSAYMLGWSSTNTLDADAAIYAILHSGQSYSTYNNAEVDTLLDEARYATADTDRDALYAEIQQLYIEDAPRIFLYQENAYYGVSDRINWDGKIDTKISIASVTFN